MILSDLEGKILRRLRMTTLLHPGTHYQLISITILLLQQAISPLSQTRDA
ncbi:hypothetical protein IAD21_02129 [Abditibacteriota bacterium]|nr:hypothetical protein IAD21_02129 [Abditibacteriota bacterium]